MLATCFLCVLHACYFYFNTGLLEYKLCTNSAEYYPTVLEDMQVSCTGD